MSKPKNNGIEVNLITPALQARPEISLRLNPANPGHYFACCGLFELAAKLVPDARAWFDEDGTTFHINGTNFSLNELLERIASAEIDVLNEADNHSAVRITSGFNLRLDWWRYENRITGKLKTWAGQMKASSILETLRLEIKSTLPIENRMPFEIEATPTSAVSYFDAPRSANSAARDVGFSMDKLAKGGAGLKNTLHPIVEFLCLVGLQRTRPTLIVSKQRAEQRYVYHLWNKPISITILPVAAIGELPDSLPTYYQFANPSRTKDYRAFVTSTPITTQSSQQLR